MLLFRDEGHIERWCRARDLTPGAALTPEQGWQLAVAWYQNKLSPEWRRHTVEEAEAVLASIGLRGAFWSLRG